MLSIKGTVVSGTEVVGRHQRHRMYRLALPIRHSKEADDGEVCILDSQPAVVRLWDGMSMPNCVSHSVTLPCVCRQESTLHVECDSQTRHVHGRFESSI